MARLRLWEGFTAIPSLLRPGHRRCSKWWVNSIDVVASNPGRRIRSPVGVAAPVGGSGDLTNSLGRPIAILGVGLSCPALLQNFLQGLPGVENMVSQECASRMYVAVAAQFQNLMMFLVGALDSVRQIQLQASIPFAAVIDVS